MHPRLANLTLSRFVLDRAASRRTDPHLLSALWADPRTRVLLVGEGRVPVRLRDGVPALDLLPPADVGQPPTGTWAFLGEDAEGVGYVAVAVDEAQEGWAGLRRVGSVLDDLEAGVLTTAVALMAWHGTHTHCPRCGAPTEVTAAGWTRRCPADASEHYPRTDPAVIMTVVDDAGRVLLGHNPAWPQGRFSTLAGFVEPGESVEAAVRREVGEEVGVVVGAVEYLGSQPWPFPASLMLGFTAKALATTVRVDGDEISSARWFTRDELATKVASGEVLPPSGLSIARRLLEHWYGGPLADGPATW
ncbi:MAG: NAD(+) diphosphatase [Actinomycetes bacterium]